MRSFSRLQHRNSVQPQAVLFDCGVEPTAPGHFFVALLVNRVQLDMYVRKLNFFLSQPLLCCFVLVQNEFRIDSSRLQPEDKGMMFRLMYFFMSFHHQLHQAAVKDAAHAGRKGADLPKFELGHVLETMDLMSFNLVLREAETAMSEKSISEQNAKRLAECVAVLKEMMHIVVSGHCSPLACLLAGAAQGVSLS